MFIDFSEERLPSRRYILKLARHKVPGGWYVRVVFTDLGAGAGARGESALFVADSEHSWRRENSPWEMLKKEPIGGIYRAKVPGGWLILATAKGEARTDDGTKYHPRLGSLVFVPDIDHSWECDLIAERDPVFGL